MDLPVVLDLVALRGIYAGGASPHEVMAAVAARMAAADPAIFITPASEAMLVAAVEALLARAPAPNSLPLWGVPFAVKDNIDVAGLPTTAGCPAFSHAPDGDATVVARLIAAGAIVIGKTNLDQFATGLNGTRSPYGAPRSVFDNAYISGGSSSGSAVAVASGLAAFALGTDTAGSGRVPAALNNIVGIKPTPGLLSSRGMLPACRSLDCITVFATTVADGAAVRRLAEGFDSEDAYSVAAVQQRFAGELLRVGVLQAVDREFYGNAEVARLYEEAIARVRALGHHVVEFDYAPFRETAALLYDGPWVAERMAAFDGLGVAWADVDPAVAGIIRHGQDYSAVDAMRGQYRLAELKRAAEATWAVADVLLLPTTPTSFTVEAMLADSITLNSRLGAYTNFFNLMGLTGIAVPAGFGADGMPGGVTLAAPAFHDDALVPLAAALHHAVNCGTGVDRAAAVPAPEPVSDRADTLPLVVVGAHLDGMALNHELQALGARLVRACRTAPDYRLYQLATVPPKPGLIREPGFAGPGIAVEVWALPVAGFARFVSAIPAPLGVGRIVLDDGSSVPGFLCEAAGVIGVPEITGFGGWRAFVAARAAALSA
jgi:allophanate hydrolase